MSKKKYTPHLPVVAVCGKFPLSALGWWNWQTRTFEGRMPKGLRVQVPPRARFLFYRREGRLKTPLRSSPREESRLSQVLTPTLLLRLPDRCLTGVGLVQQVIR